MNDFIRLRGVRQNNLKNLDLDLPLGELIVLTGKKPGMWTWPARALLEMKRLGYDIVDWGDFSYGEFAKRGGEYLLERFGAEKGRAQIEHCDLASEMRNALEADAVLETRQGLPT